MFKPGDAVVYGTHGVCIVEETSEFTFGDCPKLYYVLQPLREKLQIYVPCDNDILRGRMLPVLSIAEINEIIDSVLSDKTEWIVSDSKRKEYCNEVIKSGDRRRIIKMIDMLYTRQEELRQQKKHFHVTDDRFMKEGMRLLHEEFSYVLDIPVSEVPDYIEKRLLGAVKI